MPRCCGGSNTAIQISGTHLTISGAGSAQSPYIIGDSISVVASDNSVFDMTVSGAGTGASPWAISANFAATAKLDDLPDVNAPAPTNTQVLSWDSGTSKWIPRAPTTAASGSISHDTAFVGDGSGGSPLGVNEEPSGFLSTIATGLGLNDSGKNRLVMHYANSATRAASPLTPSLNALSMLDSAPGQVDYWNGVAWVQQGQFKIDFGTGQLLALSGSYTGGRVTQMIRQVSQITDSAGLFTVLSTTDLTGYAGVLSVTYQPTGSLAPVHVNVETTAVDVKGRAYQLSTGAVLQLSGVTGVVTAWLYN